MANCAQASPPVILTTLFHWEAEVADRFLAEAGASVVRPAGVLECQPLVDHLSASYDQKRFSNFVIARRSSGDRTGSAQGTLAPLVTQVPWAVRRPQVVPAYVLPAGLRADPQLADRALSAVSSTKIADMTSPSALHVQDRFRQCWGLLKSQDLCIAFHCNH